MPNAPDHHEGYWWEDPARLLLYFILPLYMLIALDLLGEQKAIERVYFTSFHALAGALFLGVLTVAAYAERILVPQARHAPPEIPVRVLDAMFGLALAGYLVMMGGVIAQPAILLSFLNGGANTYDVLELKGRIAGISTLTQATVAYVPLYFYVFRRPVRGFNRYKAYMVVLGVLTLLRSFIFAERLALVEALLPWALMAARFSNLPRHSVLLTLGPFAAIVPMIGFFIANEYNRSWETYYVNIYDNIFDFALERLAMYYSTALNNGAGLLTIMGWGTGEPTFTFDWLIRFPVLGEFFRPLVGGGDGYGRFLNNFGDPEFNNPSGIFVHFYEWGWFALLLAALMGWMLARSYAGWRAGDGFWCCAHAVLLVSLMEILRVPNLFSGRNFVPLALLWLVFQCFGQPARHRISPKVPPHHARRTATLPRQP
ncbi:hypothetical protein LMG31506_01380 [Cupriavidus yeoncheonensis]|uniref:Oligosaccharide repeat unit polymerase n=1 Tax=Cupriavidus yeoncheonensis TaxID=1462994 RepID=A0A916IRC0_9BURK|nr:oligosaccharide repeat unit polymerase [Cupriavidus yeoncheonensis]CAG2134411.1 hypothetical protein LMG31506_01380 [Cupriavidus yeoncheonensis]